MTIKIYILLPAIIGALVIVSCGVPYFSTHLFQLYGLHLMILLCAYVFSKEIIFPKIINHFFEICSLLTYTSAYNKSFFAFFPTNKSVQR